MLRDAVARQADDIRAYVRVAMWIGVAKYLLIYFALPSLAYGLFASGHHTGWKFVAALTSISAVIHLAGASYRRQDLIRSRLLVTRLDALQAALSDRGVPPEASKALLESLADEGVVFDSTAFALVNRLASA